MLEMQALVRRGDADEAVRVAALAIGPPTLIAVAGFLQIHTGKLFEAAPGVEARGHFVGDRFVVDEAVCAGRADGLFVEAFGVEVPAFDPRDLGADERGAVLEILGTVLRPDFELSVMRSQTGNILLALVAAAEVSQTAASESAP